MNKPMLTKIRDGRTAKILSAFLALNLLFEIISPSVAKALTAGAAAPEFSSFEPVATTDMVNDFTGDFTYNLPILSVPGPDGGGYSMSLSYHSGASSEEEASWVGFGWTLNPGAINRQKQGFADDFRRVGVETYNKIKPNWTQMAKFDFNMEYNSSDNKKEKDGKKDGKGLNKIKGKLGLTGFGEEKNEKGDKSNSKDPSDISVSLSHSVRYNNYSGFSISNGFGVSLMGMANMNMNLAGGGQATYGFSVNPLSVLRACGVNLKLRSAFFYKDKSKQGDQDKKGTNNSAEKKKLKMQWGGMKNNLFAASYPFQTYTAPALPYSVAKNSGAAWNFSCSLELNPASIPVGFQVGIAGNMNIQANRGLETRRAYGYMYASGLGNPDGNNDDPNDDSKTDVMHDFRLEKETTFDKNDKYLGVPFNNADIFSATGNGVMGGFKLMHSRIGQYYPNETKSDTKIRQIGVEIGIGLTIQVGFDIGVGKQTNTVKGKWDHIIYPEVDPHKFLYNNPSINAKYEAWKVNKPQGQNELKDYLMDASVATVGEIQAYSDYKALLLRYSSENRPAMRFTNDPGGEVQYATNGYDALTFATIGSNPKELDLSSFDLSLDNEKSQSSSYISYDKNNTNGLIEGIQITSKSGGRTEYNWPVYVKDEADFTIGIGSGESADGNQDGTYLCKHPLHYKKPLDNRTVVGQRIRDKYASSYLITAEKTFDYIDADNIKGPSKGDFGGWTKFDYRYAWGKEDASNAPWYRYRTPYNGLIYNIGKISDVNDQTGSMTTGLKQICYLKTIETKTHVALFITDQTKKEDFPEQDYPYLYKNGQPVLTLDGDGIADTDAQRKDGYDAKAINDNDDDDLAANDLKAHGDHGLQKLERIILIAKEDAAHPITTTYFKYDYSLCPGLPNNQAYFTTPSSSVKGTGKLTLKKVWTEGGGTIKSKIAPYVFDYEYFNSYPQKITSRFSWANAYNALPTNDNNQNPRYAPEQQDMWGAYQENGKERFEKMQPWVSQKNQSASFDPAVWQLKRIQLPSGGEIHIHYEQKDYSSVQDRKPLSMVSLKYVEGQSKNGYESGENRYYINTEDILVTDIVKYESILRQYFINESNKLYFKALYTYEGQDEPQLNAKNPRYEYATGYVEVNTVGHDANGIYLELGHLKGKNDNSAKDRTLPRYVCFDNELTNAGRNLGLNGTNYEDDDVKYTGQAFNEDETKQDKDLIDISRQHVVQNTIDMFKDWVNGKVKNTKRIDACRVLKFDLSYFRLPVFNDKKGGGIRVKRLLTYDPGIAGQDGDPVIYGTEYIYKNEDGSSSGVAVNEPNLGREENAMVEFLERKKQKSIDKLMHGQDLKQFEGPLGETILPAASVVHSRVIVQNIQNMNNKLTAIGYAVNKYNTWKDYPFHMTNSVIAKSNDTYKKQKVSVPLGMFNMDINKAWVTQGYLFELNDMNGKLQSQTSYPGVYSPATFDASAFTGQTVYHYTAPGDRVTTLLYDPASSKMNKGLLSPGTEEDLTTYMSNVRERTNDFSVEIDINIGYFVPSITLGFGLSYSYSESQLSQHVTSKVVRHATYLLSTTTTTDGVTQTTENLAFDKYTGDPVLTRTYDGYMAPDEKVKLDLNHSTEHDGHYYGLNIPASWIYKDMGPKSIQTVHSNQLTASAGSVVTYGGNALYDNLGSSAPWDPNVDKLKNVVNASATVYQKDWFSELDLDQYPDIDPSKKNVIKSNLRSHLYPYRSYVYRDDVKDANLAGVNIYNGGTINSLDFMNWAELTSTTNMDHYQNTDPNSIFISNQIGKWYSPSEIVAYSPFGYPVQERDALGVEGAAKFGYANTLPVLVAQNAKYEEVMFLDFEKRNSAVNNAITTVAAHSGQSSFDYSLNKNYVFIKKYPISTDMMDASTLKNGLSIKLWLRSELNDVNNKGLKNPMPNLKAEIGGQSFPFKRVAETGEWALYNVEIRNFNGLQPGVYDIQLSYNQLPGEKILIDDFRVQPLNSMMNCTVYTDDNKVAAQFDDQHFGMFYEYNVKGQLVRKSLETERGKKTLQEQQYNTPLLKERKDDKLH